MKQLRAYWDELRCDKRRAGLILGLLAVGMLLWGRLLLKEVPRTASADDTPAWLTEAATEKVKAEPVTPTLTLDRPGKPGDLFRLDLSRFPQIEENEKKLIEAKSGQEITEDILRMSVAKAAEGLRLQSVTQGEVPAAFINGQLIRVGGRIEGFTLLHCGERIATLEKQGIQVRLGM